ncbi:hypothetical protein [Planomicrobium okeanokoites]|uniref:hypothetical protein n=1 Tax=Planomicrobium okeanokoites TaxID=244 RepID=UPI000A02EBFD|nr:hypothetical protein [Planomicrobium okeanokoites]
MLLDLILLVSCCLLLLLEAVVLEHAKWLKMFEKAEVLPKQELNNADIEGGWGFNQQFNTTLVAAPDLTKKTEAVVYEQSQLTPEHENLFSALAAMSEPEVQTETKAQIIPFESLEAPIQEQEPDEMELMSWDQVVEELKKEAPVVNEEKSTESEFLTMEDWEEAPMPISMDSNLSATASHKISERFVGEQLWIVEVVGYEQSYIHVSDGESRAWLNLHKFKNANKGDILSILVERDVSDQLYVLDVDVLQRKSNEFALDIDEELENESYDYEMAL